MGSLTKQTKRSKSFQAKNSLLFQLFNDMHNMRQQLISLNARHEIFDCYIARLEKALVDKALFTQEEIDTIAKLAIDDRTPTKEEKRDNSAIPPTLAKAENAENNNQD